MSGWIVWLSNILISKLLNFYKTNIVKFFLLSTLSPTQKLDWKKGVYTLPHKSRAFARSKKKGPRKKKSIHPDLRSIPLISKLMQHLYCLGKKKISAFVIFLKWKKKNSGILYAPLLHASNCLTEKNK